MERTRLAVGHQISSLLLKDSARQFQSCADYKLVMHRGGVPKRVRLKVIGRLGQILGNKTQPQAPRRRWPILGPTSSLLYNRSVKTWDVIIVGGGIIGLSLSIALRKRGATVLIVERGEPGREASHAAAGMLADFPLEMPSQLQSLATASARMYPEFVHELQDESGINVDLRDQGTIFFATTEHRHDHPSPDTECPLPLSLDELEPALGQVNL